MLYSKINSGAGCARVLTVKFLLCKTTYPIGWIHHKLPSCWHQFLFETLLQWKSSHGKFLNHCSFPDRVEHSEPSTKKMKFIALLLLSSLKIYSASVVTDRFKSLTDILYECPLGCETNELTESHSDKILSNVDCDLNSARWDFQITVSVSSFQFVHYI